MEIKHDFTPDPDVGVENEKSWRIPPEAWVICAIVALAWIAAGVQIYFWLTGG